MPKAVPNASPAAHKQGGKTSKFPKPLPRSPLAGPPARRRANGLRPAALGDHFRRRRRRRRPPPSLGGAAARYWTQRGAAKTFAVAIPRLGSSTARPRWRAGGAQPRPDRGRGLGSWATQPRPSESAHAGALPSGKGGDIPLKQPVRLAGRPNPTRAWVVILLRRVLPSPGAHAIHGCRPAANAVRCVRPGSGQLGVCAGRRPGQRHRRRGGCQPGRRCQPGRLVAPLWRRQVPLPCASSLSQPSSGPSPALSPPTTNPPQTRRQTPTQPGQRRCAALAWTRRWLLRRRRGRHALLRRLRRRSRPRRR